MDLYSVQALIAILSGLPEPDAWLLNTYFNGVEEHEEETINVDVEINKQRITPLVHPTRAGKIIDSEGFETKSFRPAYAKDLRRFEPNAALKRSIGEKIGGELTAEQRIQANLSRALEDQVRMLTRREHVMASEIMRTGKVTVSGDGYPTVVVDFGRDSSLTVTLTSNDRWSITHADSNPLEDLELWSGLIGDLSGGTGRKVTMAPDAWRAFRGRLQERKELDMLFRDDRAGSSKAEMGPTASSPGGVVYKGNIGGFDIWTFRASYIDDAGVAQSYVPSGTVMMGDEQIEGKRCYGAIMDEEAGIKAKRYFTKSKLERNPPGRMLLLQSAPLVVPVRPNATFCATAF